MQNIDFYSGSHSAHTQPNFNTQDPEYFSKISRLQEKRIAKSEKKATRLLAIIIGLCIISFTSGLVVGIKFTGGAEKEIVDNDTKHAVSNIKTKVADMMKENSETSDNTAATANSDQNTGNVAANADDKSNEKAAKTNKVSAGQTFPKEKYPYVIKIEGEFTPRKSRDIAKYLSSKGNTVIVANNNELFNVYVGPYETLDSAEKNLKQVKNYENNYWYRNAVLIKR